METFLHSHPIFSALPNLTNSFRTQALSPTQNEPKESKRSQINPYLDHETAADILLEDAAYRCFDLARTDLAHLSPNGATHLKSPKNPMSNSQRKPGVQLNNKNRNFTASTLAWFSERNCLPLRTQPQALFTRLNSAFFYKSVPHP